MKAEEIYRKYFLDGEQGKGMKRLTMAAINDAMKEACEQTLGLAAEKIDYSNADLQYNSEAEELKREILNITIK